MKKEKLCLFMVFAILFLVKSTTGVQAKEIEDKTISPYFYIEDGEETIDSLPLKETKVSTTINGVIAETFVVQSYTNQGEKPINARYVFPASTKVSVHGMKMEIGDKVITAQIKEKEEAAAEFEQAKEEGKSASLLEQQRPNVFTMNVSNIMPGDLVNIELHYTELISPTEGIYQFVLPAVVGPRYVSGGEKNSDWAATPYFRSTGASTGSYSIDLKLSGAVPVSNIECKSHKIDIDRESEGLVRITLSNPEEFAGDRDFILEYKLTGDEMQNGVLLYEDEDSGENFFLVTVQPPERITPEEILPREYIFVLDVSGSMHGYPLDTAKGLIKNLVGNLKGTDRFNVILFSGASYQLWPTPVSATQDNIKEALYIIDRQEADGGTELTSAIEQAIAMPMKEDVSRSVVVITDGYISGEKAIIDMVSKNLSNTNFFSFGIGTSVNRYLIEGIAKAGLGEAFVVTEESEAGKVTERFRAYIESPLLTDITLSYEGFDAYDVEPEKIPTLFAQRPITIFGKWRGDLSGSIKISGKAGNKDYEESISLSEVTPSEVNSAIRFLWARTKIEKLTEYNFFGNDLDATKKTVTELGLKYSMMTPYTSFVAVLDTVRNESGESADIDQPLPLPLGVSEFSIGSGYTVGSEPGSIVFVLAMTLMLFIVARNRGKFRE